MLFYMQEPYYFPYCLCHFPFSSAMYESPTCSAIQILREFFFLSFVCVSRSKRYVAASHWVFKFISLMELLALQDAG